jgi:hypothetical protein
MREKKKEYIVSSSGASPVFRLICLMVGGRRCRQADQIIKERRLPQCVSCRHPLSRHTRRRRRRCNDVVAGPAIDVAHTSGHVNADSSVALPLSRSAVDACQSLYPVGPRSHGINGDWGRMNRRVALRFWCPFPLTWTLPFG